MVAWVVLAQPKERPDKLDIISFQTTESAELYFRNMRAYHYLHKQEAGDIFDAYRLKSLYSDSMNVALPFVIYNNWRNNEAFIRLDTIYLDKRWKTLIHDSLGNLKSTALPEMYNESQYQFAIKVYRALHGDHPAALLSNQGDTLWLEGEARKNSKRTLTDYFKLVGKL
jgi:hypothetical protein